MAAELGETTDPGKLVPGNAGALEGVAQSLRKKSGAFEDVGAGMGAVRIPGWTGKASDEFWDQFSGEKRNWLYASDAMSGAASAVSKYATVLSSAQQQARDAVALWESGDHSQAQSILKIARQQVLDEGDSAAKQLAELAGGASDAPDWLERAGKNAEQNEESGKSKLGLADLYESNPLIPDERKRRFGSAAQAPAAGNPRSPWEVKLWERGGEANAWKGEAEGETQLGDGGKLAGKADLKLLGAEGAVGASITDGNAEAKAGASAYLAKASAEGNVEYGVTAAKAQAAGFAGAEASTKVSVGKAGLHAGAEAFAGAKATGSISADVAGIGAGVTGEAWAGAGAEAHADLGMQGGKFTIGGEVGVGLGIGGKIGTEVQIDVGKFGDTVGEVSDAVGDGIDAIGDGWRSMNPFG